MKKSLTKIKQGKYSFEGKGFKFTFQVNHNSTFGTSWTMNVYQIVNSSDRPLKFIGEQVFGTLKECKEYIGL